jgi:hypothetical protein
MIGGDPLFNYPIMSFTLPLESLESIQVSLPRNARSTKPQNFHHGGLANVPALSAADSCSIS